MKFTSIENLKREAMVLRERLEPSFTPETALGGERGSIASSGHCAAVAVIIFYKFGGSLASAMVEGNSHWFNRIRVGAISVDLDLTGDQFGRPPIQIGAEGSLYHGERLRRPDDLKDETLTRASILASKAGLEKLTKSMFERWIKNAKKQMPDSKTSQDQSANTHLR